MEKEYHTTKRVIIVMYVFMALAVACLVRCLFLYNHSGQPEWLLVAAAPMLVAFVALPIVASRRVIISPVSIKASSFLGVRELFLNDIAGYKIGRTPKTMRYRIVLTSKSTGRRIWIFYSNLEDGEEILSFVQARFPLLD